MDQEEEHGRGPEATGACVSCQPATVNYRGVTFLDSTRQVYNLGNGGVPVHHDPVVYVDGICTNHEK